MISVNLILIGAQNKAFHGERPKARLSRISKSMSSEQQTALTCRKHEIEGRVLAKAARVMWHACG